MTHFVAKVVEVNDSIVGQSCFVKNNMLRILGSPVIDKDDDLRKRQMGSGKETSDGRFPCSKSKSRFYNKLVRRFLLTWNTFIFDHDNVATFW